MDLYREFEWRGLVHTASEGLPEALERGERITGYIGFDPTAASLHVGNLLPIISLARLQRFGHRAVALIGGGTGLIGDPSGKTSERTLLRTRTVTKNVAAIKAQLEVVLRRAQTQSQENESSKVNSPLVEFVDNGDWLRGLRAIKLLRDVGKHFTVNWMLSKDSIQRRLDSEGGISFTEFSYLLLQAYDFLQLHERMGCNLQMGGSDQWGNITAGMELIRRSRNAKAHGLVFPLVTTSSGTKFGKTESGAVWLDPGMTKTTEFHQFWLNVDDAEAIRYLKFFTFLSKETIQGIETMSRSEPHRRHAQRKLADEVTHLVHGEQAVAKATANAEILFAGTVDKNRMREAPEKVALARELFAEGITVARVLVLAKLASSNTDGANLIRGGAISVDGEKVTNDREVLTLLTPAVSEGVFLITRGKKQRAVVEVCDRESNN